MEEPGGLQSMGSRRVGHEWVTSLSLFTFMHWRRKWQPTPVFLPGESQGWGSLVGCRLVYGVTQSRTRLKRLSSSSSSRWGNTYPLHSLPSSFSGPHSIRNVQSCGPWPWDEMVALSLPSVSETGGDRRVQVHWGGYIGTQCFSRWQTGKGPGIQRRPPAHYPPL